MARVMALVLLLPALAQVACGKRLRVVNADAEAHSTCAQLKNQGTHFTVDLEVGTPGQKFAVVADTGSDSVVVPDCACQTCDPQAHCFRGTNTSSTFLLNKVENAGQEGVQVAQMVFGSGAVQGVIASDMVQIGGLKAFMNDTLVLMIDSQLQLPVDTKFEGILGLGPPKNATKLLEQEREQQEEEKKQEEQLGKIQKALAEQLKEVVKAKAKKAKKDKSGDDEDGKGGDDDDQQRKKAKKNKSGDDENGKGGDEDDQQQVKMVDGADLAKALQAVLGGGGGVDADSKGSGGPAGSFHNITALLEVAGLEDLLVLQGGDVVAAESKGANRLLQLLLKPKAKKPVDAALQPLVKSSFLKGSGVSRFSMCFNDAGSDGALMLQPRKPKNRLHSIGSNHWGVDFQGISVGKTDIPVKFCSSDGKKEGMTSACAAIPDSGTTLFMGPEEHIISLYESICDNWKRCKTAADVGLQKSKADLVMLLLNQCDSWMSKEEGLGELPKLYFHLAGAQEGQSQTLELDGAGYVLEAMKDETKTVETNLMGMPVQVQKPTGKQQKICQPAFGTFAMDTKQNGPVWILGSPVFYEYTVGYGLDDEKPSISFTNTEACGCSQENQKKPDAAALMQQGNFTARPLRRLTGGPRMPNLDFSRGI